MADVTAEGMVICVAGEVLDGDGVAVGDDEEVAAVGAATDLGSAEFF